MVTETTDLKRTLHIRHTSTGHKRIATASEPGEDYPLLSPLSENQCQTMGMKRLGGIGVAWLVATVVAVTIAAAAVGSVRSEVTDVPTALGVSAAPIFASAAQDKPSEPLDDVSGPETGASSTPAPDVETEPPAPPVVETMSIDGPGTETTTTPATTSITTTGPIVYEEDGTRHEEAAKSLPQAGSTTSTSSAPQPTTSTTTTTIIPTTATSSTTTVPATPTTTSTTTTTTTTTTPAPTPYTRAIDTDGGSLSVRVNGYAVVFRRAFPNNGWRFDLASGGPEVVEARFTKTDDRSTRIRVLVTVTDGALEISITPSK